MTRSEGETAGESFNEITIEERYWGDTRTQSLILQFGAAATTVHIRVMNRLAATKEHAIKKGEFLLIAKNMGIGTPTALLEFLCSEDIGYLSLDGDLVRCPGLDGRLKKRMEARKKWREEKRKPKLPTTSGRKSDGKPEETVSSVSVPGGTPNTNTTDPQIPDLGFLKIGPYACISEIEHEQFRCSKGDKFLNRCFEVINAWVDDAGADHSEHLKRKARAKNSGALFKNWVFERVEDDMARRKKRETRAGPYAKESNFDRNIKILRES